MEIELNCGNILHIQSLWNIAMLQGHERRPEIYVLITIAVVR